MCHIRIILEEGPGVPVITGKSRGYLNLRGHQLIFCVLGDLNLGKILN